MFAVVAAVPLVLGLAAAAALRLQYAGTPADWAGTTGRDALWLGHAWVDGRRTEADVRALAVRLGASGIRDVYVHSGPFTYDGTLPPDRYPNAGNFLKWWRKHVPDVRVSAWLGQTVDDNGKPHLSLADPAARARVVAGAKDLVALGFDGIHYDFEPVSDGDGPFLSVLRDTRAVIGDRLLSVATQQIEPLSGLRAPTALAIGHDKYWTPDYFRQVVDLTDQVAIMTYDSWLPLTSLYGGHVARQATLALDLVPEDKTLLIGAPAYHDHGVWYGDWAESVEAAAEGARLALSDHGPRTEFGLALYVDFAATEEDWREYGRAWVRGGAGGKVEPPGGRSDVRTAAAVPRYHERGGPSS
ncbi:membrane protein [Microbispora rosea subsp. aerata]|nr:membrane protein [Microbispora rosea subsp. aerata]GIH53184.1 membrane protein [Microbispora rosea subsp. aerata]GLJ83904.1 membrane protein [Microbispora rosea subsp. aerata]